MPYQLQLAYGWTRLMIQSSLVAVAVLVPAIWVLVPRYGAISAAWSGVALNGAYLVFTVHIMHRRLLTDDGTAWYCQDVLMPLTAAAAVAWGWRLAAPVGASRVIDGLLLAIGYCLCLAAAILVAPIVRRNLGFQLRSGWQRLQSSY